MLEVASPAAISLWDRPPELWPGALPVASTPDRCAPLESFNCQSVRYFDLQSVWNSIAPRSQTPRRLMQNRPALELVQPAEIEPKKRRISKPRSPVDQQKPAPNLSKHAPIDLSRPLEPVEPPSAFQQPHGTLSSDGEPAISTSSSSRLPRFPDTLFSSTASERGVPYDPSNLCDLCRQPFEANEDALYTHLSRHLRELGGTFSCNQCQISFSHVGDLRWHIQDTSCSGSRHRLEARDSPGHFPPGVDDERRFKFCMELRNWEQAQMNLHSQTIEYLYRSRSTRTPRRSASLPPRKRVPLDQFDSHEPTGSLKSNIPSKSLDDVNNGTSFTSIDDHMSGVEPKDNNPYRFVTVDQSDSNTRWTVYSLQRRILDLMEKIQPGSPEDSDQDTPYSEFCDSHSLPGSPEQLSKDTTQGGSPMADRALSEPPKRRTALVDDSIRTMAYYPDGTSGAGGISGAWDCGASKGQKRGNNAGDSGESHEEHSSNGGIASKKRKVAGGNGTEKVKRFPCIFHIGDPARFGGDTSKHQHISNMCRHLKSHDFYACSTCILRVQSPADLETHIGQHVKACSKKGCKRTKPAGSAVDPTNCFHLMTSEDQWRALFVLQFRRQPPNIFGVSDETQIDSMDITTTGATTSDTAPYPGIPTPMTSNIANESSGIFDLNDSFFDDAMNFDLGMPMDNTQPATPPLDISDYIDPSAELQVTVDKATNNDTSEARPVVEPLREVQPVEEQTDKSGLPMHDLVNNLQQQVTALETILSNQTNKEKDRLYQLQEKVVQMEQKLFQSSERERQLEATLGVIFDAFQATGAPQAQPNKALWNLVMSHSSQAIGSVTGSSKQPEEKQDKASPGGYMPMTPSLTFAERGRKESVRTPADSTYGSVR